MTLVDQRLASPQTNNNMSEPERHLKDYASRALQRSKHARLFRIGYELAAWLSPLAAVFGFFLLYIFVGIKPAPLFIVWGGFGVIAIFVRCRTLAKRYALDPQSVVLKDERQPILYLRSFKQDRDGGGRDYAKKTELSLTSALSDIGPLVAVGEPGEELPPLGATRFYFENHEWKERVKELMSMSGLVVIHPSNTDGVEWEIAAVKQNVPPERIVFVLASWLSLKRYGRRIEYDLLSAQLKDLMGISLPAKADGYYFLYFTEDWSPQFSRPSWFGRWTSSQSIASFRAALKPVFKNTKRS